MQDAGCCVLRKAPGDGFVADFNEFMGPEGVRLPFDEINAVVDGEYQKTYISWHGKEEESTLI